MERELAIARVLVTLGKQIYAPLVRKSGNAVLRLAKI
jgi:hypothetical protein